TDGVPTFGKSEVWNPSSVYKIAHSRAAVGEYQPRRKRDRAPDGDAIAGYFPQIVSEAQWWAAQSSLKGRKEGGRRAGRHDNPFAGLLTDARDGGKIYMTGPSRRANGTLVNYGATRGRPGSRYVSFPTGPFVHAIFSKLREVNLVDILEGAGQGASEIDELS